MTKANEFKKLIVDHKQQLLYSPQSKFLKFMRYQMFSQKISKLSLVGIAALMNVVFLVPSHAAEKKSGTMASDLDYGEMYVVQKHEAPSRPWEASLTYSYGFSNPYIGIHGLGLGVNRQLGDFVIVGFSGSYYANTTSNVSSDIQDKLGGQGISTLVIKPHYSSYANIGLIPLSGILNWFGTKSMNFDLVVGVGGGIAGYHDHAQVLPAIRGFITPKLMLDNVWGLTAGINSTWDRFSSEDWQNRVETTFGVFARF